MSKALKLRSTDTPLRLLFITRKFPPSKGGMETVAFELYTNFESSPGIQTKLISWGGSNKLLPIILPSHLFRACCALLFGKYDVIYIQDGVLALIGYLLNLLFQKPIFMTVHGLDLTYSSKFYRRILLFSIRRINTISCVSEATKDLAIGLGIPLANLITIKNGVSDIYYMNELNIQTNIPESIKKFVGNKKVLLTSGRLVRRKGVAWFTGNVMPEIIKLFPDVVYLISGDGVDRKKIQQTIKEQKLEKKVKLLGFTEPDVLKSLYNICDVFVMPNIKVQGDQEGFGVVAIEAASCATPVVASNIEGISDAIHNGKNGVLVSSLGTNEYIKVIEKFLSDDSYAKQFGRRAREYTLKTFSWEEIAKQYIKCFNNLIR